MEIKCNMMRFACQPVANPLKKETFNYSCDERINSDREKLEHLKLVIKELQSQLSSYKIRVEGATSVTKLLQESRRDLSVEQERNKVLEAVVTNLRSRLVSNNLSASTALDEDEIFIPGHSQQLIENLVSETVRLQNALDGCRTMNEKLVEEKKWLSQNLLSSQSKIKELMEENKDLQGEISCYKRNLCTEDERDNETPKIQESLERREFQSQSCPQSSLHKADDSLKTMSAEIKKFSVYCQQMAIRLEVMDNQKSLQPVASPTNKGSEISVELFQQIQEEKRKLEEKYKESHSANQRWQNYNFQREEVVQQLRDTINELRGKKPSGETSKTLHIKPNEKPLYEAQENKIATLQETLNQCKTKLELSEKFQKEMQQQYDETVSALKAQVQICTEDFQSERKDREVAQSRISELEEQLRKGENEVQSQNFKEKYLDLRWKPYSANNLVARGPQSAYENVEVDGVVPKLDRALSDNVAVLPCPKCQKKFTSDKHNELLDHIDFCCD